MQRDAFNLGQQIKLHTFEFRILPVLWDEFQIAEETMNSLVWKEIKFLNEQGIGFSDEVNQLPNDKGGIYLFIIKSKVLPGTSEYLAYVGRAQITNTHNLRVRCRRYLTEYLNEKERPKITTLMEYFRNHVYLRYTEIEDNDLIVALEAELINSILPPFNDKIPKKKVRQAVDAF